jgi:BirA family biotin operon repressor/biotin-[acetyl-CoA-carboxylase] ligase
LAIRIFLSTDANVGGVGAHDHLRDETGEPEAAADRLAWPPGWHVRRIAETGSTNADLLADAAAVDRTVLVADHQTAGRGRLDRIWEAPPGTNLLVSVLFRVLPDDSGELMRRMGVAVVDAVRSIGVVGAALKWPNDVLLDDRKLAGLLAQQGSDGRVVVGIGLNVGWSPAGAADLGGIVEPIDMLTRLLVAYDALPADLHERYRSALGTLGRRVRVELPSGEIVGTAVDIEADGRLIVVDECAMSHRLAVGDVVHLRSA